MQLTLLDLLVAAVVLALVGYVLLGGRGLFGGHGTDTLAVLASAAFTPGSLNPDVTQATIASTICVRGWTKTVRPPQSYTGSLKLRQMRAYGERGPPSAYQEDHLISLELGGNPTDPGNLWPEPYPRAADVDKIENALNARVCSGELTLAEAQRQESELKHEHG
jgi:hypothetical protein